MDLVPTLDVLFQRVKQADEIIVCIFSVVPVTTHQIDGIMKEKEG